MTRTKKAKEERSVERKMMLKRRILMDSLCSAGWPAKSNGISVWSRSWTTGQIGGRVSKIRHGRKTVSSIERRTGLSRRCVFGHSCRCRIDESQNLEVRDSPGPCSSSSPKSKTVEATFAKLWNRLQQRCRKTMKSNFNSSEERNNTWLQPTEIERGKLAVWWIVIMKNFESHGYFHTQTRHKWGLKSKTKIHLESSSRPVI